MSLFGRRHKKPAVVPWGVVYSTIVARIGRILHYRYYTTCTWHCVQYGGLAGPHAVIATILHSFLAMGVVSVLWVIFGFSLAFGEDDGHG